ncbi:hypothetical protein [Pseudomonas subflava]|uniref:hypothetical protein n=1 Tax=Pseudomonas subflava TaxID=2952933 RepID=UPI00207A289F|nr:hypothetical protein [Pseudomonas subflava]
MALVVCKDCKTEISTDAKVCPQCGAHSAAGYTGVRVAGLFYLALIGLLFWWVWGLMTPDSSQDVVVANAQAEQPKAPALAPKHFATVGEMIEDRGDYSAENGTFEQIAAEPLKILIAGTIVPGDLAENNAREVRRAALYGVYRTLIHTGANKVTVVAVPRELNIREGTSRVLDRPTLSITATRAQALEAASRFVKVDTAADLVNPQQEYGIQLDSWKPEFEAVYMSDQGQIKLLEAIKAAGGDVISNG